MILNKKQSLSLTIGVAILTFLYTAYVAWLHTDSYPFATNWDRALGVPLLLCEFPWLVISSLPHVPASALPVICTGGQALLLWLVLRSCQNREVKWYRLILLYVGAYVMLTIVGALVVWLFKLNQ